MPKLIPDLPGDGLFKYKGREQSDTCIKKRKSVATLAKGQLPKFMGMPLYGLRSSDSDRNESSNNGTSALSDR